MAKKYIMVSIDDEKAKEIAEAIGNNTCRQILEKLSENEELSEKDLADKISAPINTIEYNLVKLLNAGLVEKSTNFFWSVKGRKIPMYKISNKEIIISPKSSVTQKLKAFGITLLFGGFGALAVSQLFKAEKTQTILPQDMMMATASKTAEESASLSSSFFSTPHPAWLWFTGGLVFAMLIFAIFNWNKIGERR